MRRSLVMTHAIRGSRLLRGYGLRAAELVTLSTFAIASPLLGVVGDQPVFLIAHDVIGWRVVLFAAALVVIPAVLLLAVDLVVTLLTDGSDVARAVISGVVLGVILLQHLRQITPDGAVPTLLLFGVLSLLGTWAYSKWKVLRSALRIGALASLVFVAVFLFASPVSALLEDFDSEVPSVSARGETSIVFVLFDQFPLSLLVDTDGRIASSRFPNFARLAEMSTWYRNAVTVSSETSLAVPALLSGQIPEPDTLPVVSQRPENLFTLLGSSHSITAYETFTQLCPDALCRNRDELPSGALVGDLLVVLVRSLIDAETADQLVPELGTAWAGFVDPGQLSVDGEATTMEEARENRMRGDDRERVDDFLAGLSTIDPPGLHYLHLEKPHEPLLFVPDGRIYDFCNCYSVDEDGRWPTSPMTSQRLQRYLLQGMYADTVLGRVLDTLESHDRLHSAMLVVVSDHGAGLLPGMKNRELTADNAVEILPVPLFIKMPGQVVGGIDSRQVQVIDVFPTVLETVGLVTTKALDGLSLTGEIPPGRRHIYVGRGNVQTIGAPPIVDESKLPRWIAELFPDPSNPYAFGAMARLHGDSVDDSDIAKSRLEIELATDRVLVGPRPSYVPAHVIGTVVNAEKSTEVVVTVDGVVAGMGSTFLDGDVWRLSVMLDPAMISANSRVNVYEVQGDDLLEMRLR